MTTSRPTCRNFFNAFLCGAVGCAVAAPTDAAAPAFAGFARAKFIAVGDGPLSVKLGDLNGDGALDLAVSNRQQGAVSVRFGQGNGDFQGLREYPVGPFPAGLDLGDIDGDGDLDLVTTQNPSGASEDGVIILRNNGAGGFTLAGFQITGSSPESVELTDLNDDQHLDLVVGVFNDVAVLMGDGMGGFSKPIFLAAATSFVVAKSHDINEDGFPDIVAAGYSDSAVTVLYNLGDGHFGAPMPYPCGQHPRSFAIGDVDRDGTDDIVVVGATDDAVGALFLLKGLGGGEFAAPVEFASGGEVGSGVGPWDVTLADLDFDNDLDIAASNEASGDVSVFINNGFGEFETPRFFPVGSSARMIAVGDLNDDRSPDLVVASLGSDAVSVLLNLTRDPIDLSGNGLVDAVDLAIMLTAWGTDGSTSGADLNGDGVVNGVDLAILLSNWSN